MNLPRDHCSPLQGRLRFGGFLNFAGSMSQTKSYTCDHDIRSPSRDVTMATFRTKRTGRLISQEISSYHPLTYVIKGPSPGRKNEVHCVMECSRLFPHFRTVASLGIMSLRFARALRSAEVSRPSRRGENDLFLLSRCPVGTPFLSALFLPGDAGEPN